MSVNIFGSRSGLKPPTNQNYNSKFIFLTHSLQTKVDKSGDSMTGNLNMANNKITGVSDPTLDDDVCNKRHLSSVMNLNNQNYNSKFVWLTENLQVKVDKSGDTMTGDLNMANNKITGVSDPTLDHDVCNKRYLSSVMNSDSIITKLYVDTLLHMKRDKNMNEDFDMNGFAIANTKIPVDPLDGVNKLYLQISMQKDDITMEKLLKIGTIIEDLFNKYKTNITLNNSRNQFSKCMYYVQTICTEYAILFDGRDENVAFELLYSSTLFTDLKIVIIKIIEILPEGIFTDFKDDLMIAKLVTTPEGRNIRKRHRRFINRRAKDVDPTRFNQKFELAVQKNLLLIDLGFIYFIESLLKVLLDGRIA